MVGTVFIVAKIDTHGNGNLPVEEGDQGDFILCD